MLVQPLTSTHDEDYWEIVFLCDQDDQLSVFKQQTKNLEFNNMGCQVLSANTFQRAIELINSGTALLVVSHSNIETAVGDIYRLIDKTMHPDLCILAVVEDTSMQQDLLKTMLVDQTVSSLETDQLIPALLTGLKRHFDTRLLQISQSLLHSMRSINETSTGDVYLKDLAISIAKILGTHFVVIGETDVLDDTIVKTRVVWMGGSFQENFIYKRSGSPCERVLKCQRVITYPKDVVKEFPDDEMLAQMDIESYMGTAIYSSSGSLTGILITMDCSEMENYSIYEPVLDFFASRVGVEFERQRAEDKLLKINEELEAKVSVRTQELKETHKELLQAAHQAGMADIAAGVLHNVGNVFNSMSVACQSMQSDYAQSKLSRLADVSKLLNENKNALTEYIMHDEKGQQLPEYISGLNKVLNEEAELHQGNLNTMLDNGYLVQEVIRNQLDYAQLTSFEEGSDVAELVDKVLSLQMAVMDKAHIKIEKMYADISSVQLQKNKLVHVLINLFKNSREAMALIPGSERKIIIKISDKEKSCVQISVTDTGVGFSASDKKHIFSLGHTTKENSHGIGLHVSLNYMLEMGGTIKATSPGENMGATFIIELPKDVVAA